jgi:hypothetical protein
MNTILVFAGTPPSAAGAARNELQRSGPREVTPPARWVGPPRLEVVQLPPGAIFRSWQARQMQELRRLNGSEDLILLVLGLCGVTAILWGLLAAA